jgi:Transglutaminase-like superfamily
MTESMSLEHGTTVPFWNRFAARVAVTLAWPLSRQSPHRLRRILHVIRRGATPATHGQALAARHAVVTVSTRCAGQGCLQRSLATALLCRLRGVWPTWCTGVRAAPFRAHAWVEVNGHPIGEPYPPGYYTPTLTIPPQPYV